MTEASSGITSLELELESHDWNMIMSKIDLASIEEHTQYLASLGSRVTGYPGFETAAEYISSKFVDYGLENVHFEYYNVTVPLDNGAKVTVLSPEEQEIPAYPLWPSSVATGATPRGGLSGRLIYVGNGDLSDFDGKDVNGSIVLMEFNSGDNWLHAAMLGAEAVIFTSPPVTTSQERYMKVADVPVTFPKLYLTPPYDEYLRVLSILNDDVVVRVNVDMTWRVVPAKNVVGFVNGTDESLRNDVVVLSSYFDSFSIVPSLSPGASEALSTSALLNLAQFFSQNPPKRTIMFVAFSGHNQLLAGSRSFVWDHFDEVTNGLNLFFTLDFSVETSDLSLRINGAWLASTLGWASPRGSEIPRSIKVASSIFGQYLPSIKEATNREYSLENFIQGAAWFEPNPVLIDSDPFTIAGGVGLAFYTTNALRLYRNTPFDTFERLDFTNLRPQLDIVFCSLYALSNEGELGEAGTLTPNAFAVVRGDVLKYDVRSGWFTTVPHAMVQVYAPNTIINLVTKADANGHFELRGLRGAAAGTLGAMPYGLFAFSINDTGAITAAPDYGQYSSQLYSRSFYVNLHERWVNAAVFECGSIVIYHNYNPMSLGPTLEMALPYDISTHTEFSQWSALQDRGKISVIFLPPNQRAEITQKSTETRWPLVLLRNSDAVNPDGWGYEVNLGEQSPITSTPVQVAENYYWINTIRLGNLAEYSTYSAQAQESFTLGNEHLQTALSALKDKQYSEAIVNGVHSWTMQFEAYTKSLDLIRNVTSTTIFFFLMAMPFCFVAERLFFTQTDGRRRLGVMVAIFIVCIGFLYFFHAGFHIASSNFMVVFGCAILVLAGVVIALLFSDMTTYVGTFRKRMTGLHFADISRFGALLMAFSTGVSNMKKRALRTSLMLVSLILITFALITFTSISTLTITRTVDFTGSVSYPGILLRKRPFEDMAPQFLQELKAKFGQEGIVVPRAFIYPFQEVLFLESGALVKAFLGLAPEEDEITHISRYLSDGRFFSSGDYMSCILPVKIADQIQARVGSTVNIWGMNVTVIGLIHGDALTSMVDLDQRPITPLSLMAAGIYGGIDLPNLPSDTVVLIPYKLAIDMLPPPVGAEQMGALIEAGGGATQAASASRFASIAIKFANSSLIEEAARELSLRLSFDIIIAETVGTDQLVQILQKKLAYNLAGWNYLIMPFIVAGFSIFNLMLGTVAERGGEIGIYASVGLSPLHVSCMFLAETLVYSIIGVVVGYILGIISGTVSYAFRLLPPGFYPNYSSEFVIIAGGLVMAATLLSTLYPMSKAARIVTPSFKRKWEIPTKPKNDEWTVPLPFVIEETVLPGLLVFMYEYLRAHFEEESGLLWVSDVAYQEERDEDRRISSIVSNLRVAPFEMGIVQTFVIRLTFPKGDTKSRTELYIRREAGPIVTWVAANYPLIDEFRKQFLIWEGLREPEKESYISRSDELNSIRRLE